MSVRYRYLRNAKRVIAHCSHLGSGCKHNNLRLGVFHPKVAFTTPSHIKAERGCCREARGRIRSVRLITNSLIPIHQEEPLILCR